MGGVSFVQDTASDLEMEAVKGLCLRRLELGHHTICVFSFALVMFLCCTLLGLFLLRYVILRYTMLCHSFIHLFITLPQPTGSFRGQRTFPRFVNTLFRRVCMRMEREGGVYISVDSIVSVLYYLPTYLPTYNPTQVSDSRALDLGVFSLWGHPTDWLLGRAPALGSLWLFSMYIRT